MACRMPYQGWAAKERNLKTGRRGFTTDPRAAFTDRPMTIPCGQCMECRLKRKADWATRIEKEAKLFPDNCFLTLTYAPEHLPVVFSEVDGLERSSVSSEVLSEFMERFRNALRDAVALRLREQSGTVTSRRGKVRFKLGVRAARREALKVSSGVRFFGCGEYGEQNGRAHYHVAIFGWNSLGSDIMGTETARSGFTMYQSKIVSKAWPFGRHTVMGLTYKSGAYVAGYIGKAITGLGAEAAYDAHGVGRPFQNMSRMPGIGRVWLEHFGTDVYPSGSIVLHGGKVRSSPPYYDNLLREADPAAFASLKARRRSEGLARAASEPVHAATARAAARAAQVHPRDVG
jgi:hypothetical protein